MDTAMTQGEMNQQSYEALVHTYTVLVKRIAHHLLSRLPQSVQLDDLIQAGMLGLLEAARHYDPTKGASFETYAGIRIRGHILDELRHLDWVPRSVHRNTRKISEAVAHIEHQLGREAKDTEIVSELGISLSEYHDMLQDSANGHVCGFDDVGAGSVDDEVQASIPEPHSRVLRDDLMMHLNHIIDNLPPQERMALSLYYEHDLNLKEIGDVLDVSESRVSQILSQATLHVRSRCTSL